MIKNIILVLFSVLILSGCSSTSKSSLTKLYPVYLKYEKTTNEKNIVKLADNFFSSRMLKELEEAGSIADSKDLLLFKNYIINKDSHYEKINAHVGCLSINGLDEENSPVILSLKYTLMNDSWLIDEIHILYFDSKEEFTKSAKCPNDFPSGFS